MVFKTVVSWLLLVSIFYRVTSNGKLRMITEIIRSAILYLDTQLIFST